MKAVRVNLGARSYPVYVGRAVLKRLPALLKRHGFPRQARIITDEFLRGKLGKAVLKTLNRAGIKTALFALPRGEKAKSFSELMRIYEALLRSQTDRKTPIIALGGGTVGDVAGFAAASFYRGIPLVHVPTTLLAQVDSAIGGKTGVNLPLAKNAVGAFYQPAFVLSDIDVLISLPEREFRSGLSEVVKYGLVFDRDFAQGLRLRAKAIAQRNTLQLEKIVCSCAQFKASVVSQDERDTGGPREFLNFGHTLGHALETATNYDYFRHGEAVAWGMRVALELSIGRGWLSPADLGLSQTLLGALQPPAPPASLKWPEVGAYLKSDKKMRKSRNVFILLKGIGKAVKVDDVSPEELKRAALQAGLSMKGLN